NPRDAGSSHRAGPLRPKGSDRIVGGMRPPQNAPPPRRSPRLPPACHPSIIAESLDDPGARMMADQQTKGSNKEKKSAAAAAGGRGTHPPDDKKITPRAADYSQ